MRAPAALLVLSFGACGDGSTAVSKASGDRAQPPRAPTALPSASARSTDELSIARGWFCYAYEAEMPFDAGPCTHPTAHPDKTSCPNDVLRMTSSTCERTLDACARAAPPMPPKLAWRLGGSTASPRVPSAEVCKPIEQASCFTPEGGPPRCFIDAAQCEAWRKEHVADGATTSPCKATP
ncbi:MAG: hypothetical protein U0414_25330 [Polyangiaceae bacterium]